MFLRNARTLEATGPKLLHPEAVLCVEMDRDGNRIVTGCFDEKLRMGHRDEGDRGSEVAVAETKCLLPRRVGYPLQIAAESGRETVAVSLGNGDLRHLDIATLTRIRPDFVHPGDLYGAAFRPDGLAIATGCGDRNAYLWTLGRERGIPLTMAHPADVDGVGFSPDGKLLLTGCLDGSARLWDVATGKPIGKPFRHDAGVISVCFSPDGGTVLTTSFDKTARLWKVPPRTLGGTADDVASWIEGLTGLEFRGGGDLRVLDFESWKQSRNLASRKIFKLPILDPILRRVAEFRRCLGSRRAEGVSWSQILVCRVKTLDDPSRPRLEFTWSCGSAYFGGIVLGADEVRDFRDNSRAARECHPAVGGRARHPKGSATPRDPSGVRGVGRHRLGPVQPAAANERPRGRGRPAVARGP